MRISIKKDLQSALLTERLGWIAAKALHPYLVAP
jgi:hypothetical protein